MIKLLCLAVAPAALLFLAASAPTAVTPPPGAPSAPDTYKIDGGHSSVVFKVKHAGIAWFYGTFAGVSGSLAVDEADPSKSSVQVEIEAASVNSNNEERDGHIRSPDFLSVKEFPEISFKSKTVTDGGKGNLEVTGDLTFRGVTRPITVPVEFVGKGEFHGQRVGYEARFTFKRSEFGSTYGLEGDALGDEVHMIVSLEALQQ